MKHLKNFNEKKDNNDIFSNVDNLYDILLEYKDEGFDYTLKYMIFKLYTDDKSFMPILSKDDKNKCWNEKTGKIHYSLTPTPSQDNTELQNRKYNKGYRISFKELYTNCYYATDVQRGDNQRVFGKSDRIYNFFEVTKLVQERLESMGYIFLLSTHKNAEFDIIIIEQ